MVTLNVYVEDKKSEKVIKAVLDTQNVSYDIEKVVSLPSLSKEEKALFGRVKQSVNQIKQDQAGKTVLRDANELLGEDI